DSVVNTVSSATAPSTASVVTAVNPLPGATVGKVYTTTVLKTVAGGRGSYHYQSGTFASGTPPIGMILTNTGTLTGTPQKAGKYSFQLCTTDTYSDLPAACAATSITVAAATTTPAPTPTPVAGT